MTSGSLTTLPAALSQWCFVIVIALAALNSNGIMVNMLRIMTIANNRLTDFLNIFIHITPDSAEIIMHVFVKL